MHQDDFYGEPRGASLSWGNPGQRVHVNEWRGGLVVSVGKKQATDMAGKPKFWPDANGNPDTARGIQSLVITVHAEGERDPNNPTDDGMRSIYIDQESLKYSKNNKNRPGQPKEGVKYGAHCDAMEAAGVPKTLPEPGGYYYLMLTGEVQGEGSIPRGTWMANYQRPTLESMARLEQVTRPAAAPAQDSMYVTPPTQQAPQGPPQNGYQQAQQQPRWSGNGQQYQQPAYAHAGPPQNGYQQAPQGPPQPPGQQTFVQPAQPTVGAIGYQQQAPQGPPQNGYQQAQQQYAQQPPPGGTQTQGPPQQYQQAPPAPPQHQSPPPPPANPYQR